MKQKLFLMAMTAMLAACSASDDATQGIASKGDGTIQFQTAVSAPTRAQTLYPNAAALQTGGFSVAAVGSSDVYFAPTTATWKTGTTFVAGDKIWPDYNLSFYAFAPVSAPTTTSISPSTKTLSFTQDATTADQKDLVVAYSGVVAHHTDPVAIDFKHALSQIALQATNGNTTDYRVVLKGAKLGFLPQTATMTFPTAKGVNVADVSDLSKYIAAEYPTWAGHTTLKSYTAELATHVDADATAKPASDVNFYMLPQTLNLDGAGTGETAVWDGAEGTQITSGAYLAIECEIYKTNGTPSDPSDDTKIYDGYSAVSLTGTGSTDIVWQPGKKYTYTLNFFTGGGGGGQIDPDQPVEPGKPIIAPITFTVTITDWFDAGTTSINMK